MEIILLKTKNRNEGKLMESKRSMKSNIYMKAYLQNHSDVRIAVFYEKKTTKTPHFTCYKQIIIKIGHQFQPTNPPISDI